MKVYYDNGSGGFKSYPACYVKSGFGPEFALEAVVDKSGRFLWMSISSIGPERGLVELELSQKEIERLLRKRMAELFPPGEDEQL